MNNFTFFKLLKEKASYQTGLFGKFLNVCPEDPPPGFDAWYANGGGSYFAPSFFVQNVSGLPDGPVNYNQSDYSTALIGNYSLAWIKQAATTYLETKQPFIAYIAPKANHDPFLPAPWYQDV